MYKFLEEVAKNIEAEADAIEKYSELLAVTDNEIDEFNDLEFVHSEIAEIISDELNHIDRLKRMFSHFSGIETAED
jgi:bacterioferritin (cytochrome b1)